MKTKLMKLLRAFTRKSPDKPTINLLGYDFVIDSEGNGDFRTVQEALDYIQTVQAAPTKRP